MKERAVKLIKKHGCDGVHAMILKKKKFSDFMSVLSRIIFALDTFSRNTDGLSMLTCARIINNSGLSAAELIELHEHLDGHKTHRLTRPSAKPFSF